MILNQNLNPHLNEKNIYTFFFIALFVHLLLFLNSSHFLSIFNFKASPLNIAQTQSLNINLESFQSKPLIKKSPKALPNKLSQERSDITEQKNTNTLTKNSATAKATPHAKSKIHAIYPPLAEEMQTEGTVYMKFLVNAVGKVLTVEVVKSSGSKLLDKAAVKAIKTAVFNPATDKNGTAVQSWGEYSIDFSLTEES